MIHRAAMIHRDETPVGGYGGGGDTPLQSQESWSGRENYRNSSCEFWRYEKNTTYNVLTAR